MRTMMIILLSLKLLLTFAFADTHVLGDVEGSFDRLDALITEGKLRWETQSDGSRRLAFVNSTDNFVFEGDLSGGNLDSPGNPRNIELREALLGFQERYPTRVGLVLGNHEYNRLAFVRENIMMQRGEHSGYRQWLNATRQAGETTGVDSRLNRVQYWANQFYGGSGNIAPTDRNPLVHYQQELTNRAIAEGRLRPGQTITIEQAAAQFTRDLDPGGNGRQPGRMLQYIMRGQEIVYMEGFHFHGPPNDANVGRIPGENYDLSSGNGRDWVQRRNDRFFRPQMEQFIAAAQSGNIPSDTLVRVGDASYDPLSRVVNNPNTVTYTERTEIDTERARGVKLSITPDTAEFLCRGLPPSQCRVISGHKPVGEVPAVYRVEYTTPDGTRRTLFDVGVDTSQGRAGGAQATTTIRTNGNINITANSRAYDPSAPGNQGAEVRVSFDTGPELNSQIGRVTADGWLVKGVDANGNYVLERMGFESESARDGFDRYETRTRVVTPQQLGETSLPGYDPNNHTRAVQLRNTLVGNIERNAGTVLNSSDEIARFINGRYVIDFSGDADYVNRINPDQQRLLRERLMRLAGELDPERVVILNRGVISSNPNGIENIVRDIFSNPNKPFTILGVTPSNTPATQIDTRIKNFVLTPAGTDFDGAFSASRRILLDNRGVSVTIGGQAVVERSLLSAEGRQLATEGRSFRISDVEGVSARADLPGSSLRLTDLTDRVIGSFNSSPSTQLPINRGTVVGAEVSPSPANQTPRPPSASPGSSNFPASFRCKLRSLDNLIQAIR